MSLFIDQRYVYLLSPKLDLFKQKKDGLWNFRCPICNDSKKSKLKARAYVYTHKGNLLFRCHNCGHSCSLGNLIKQVDPRLFREYQLDRYKAERPSNVKAPNFAIAKTKPVFKKTLSIPKISDLDAQHSARVFVENRKIPVNRWSDLHYTDDFKNFVKMTATSFDSDRLKPNDPRVVLPFFDRDGDLLGFQGRGLNKSQIRYITIKMSDESPKIFGLDRVDMSKKIYVTEGPFDSMFLSNSVAVMDANLSSARELVGTSNLILVFDNEPRNREIIKYMERAISSKFAVCVWPHSIFQKDINDMILAGYSSEQLEYIIDQNTFSDLKAQLQFNLWRKA